MIINVEEIMSLPEFKTMNERTVQRKLNSLEVLIRKYTNNNFQNKNIRFKADSVGTILNGFSSFLRVGDTVQITESKVNDGLYVVKDIGIRSIVVDKPLFTVAHNLVTKVEYPIDVVEGIINLMKWEVSNRDKVGVKSETISRHSVTYFDLDANNQVMGYPVSVLGFLKPYKKVRF
ncbi:hypothetical protein P261_02273 [Lachnospiraceae bacterium TWA4]|nr:hypothetical protein P261_02273 [Lachnospiraceae bacterium TWA4]